MITRTVIGYALQKLGTLIALFIVAMVQFVVRFDHRRGDKRS